MDKFKKAELMKVEFEEETDGYLWFKVRSPSGFTYRVSYSKEAAMFKCECLSFIYNEMLMCSHMIAVKNYAPFLIKETEVLQVE